MKNFLSSMLGSLAALVVFAGAILFFCFLLLVGIAALGEKPVVVEQGAYLVVDLSTNITDAPPQVDFSALLGRKDQTLQLRTVTRSIRAAAQDERISGILLLGSLQPRGYGAGYAALREVREALMEFRDAGKPVKAYLTYAMSRDYYLASVADEVALDPFGAVVLPGLASEPMFLAGAFEKYGVGVQVTRVGKYKSFSEPFTHKALSPENREQMQKLLDDLWGTLRTEIAAARGLEVPALQAVVDTEGILRAEVAKDAGLVDRIAYRDEILTSLKEETGRTGADESFAQIDLASYARVTPEATGASGKGRRGQIAVVYAEGDIVDGEGEPGQVGGVSFARELRRLRQDDDVKAIVLRVNSPGGSASASEAIQREMRLAADVKPVVISMGTSATSGGYWISAYGDRIFAEPTTITGSIGVIGIFFDVQKLAGDFGVTFDRVKTGRYADTFTLSRPKTGEEMKLIQHSVDWVYDEFIDKVAEGRGLDRQFVEEIAQGRVWSGTEAKTLGLVDELGGLEAALAHAAERSGLEGHYRITEFPRKKELTEAVAEMLDGLGTVRARGGAVEKVTARVGAELRTLRSFNDPRGIYARVPFDLTLQ